MMPKCFANTEPANIAAYTCTKVRPYKVLEVANRPRGTGLCPCCAALCAAADTTMLLCEPGDI